MSISPLISIGIPTYNRPEGLKKTLEHVTRQSYKNIEIIISDNASTDIKVDDVINSFLVNDRRIKYFKQSDNQGAAYNFKFVYEKATGEYFIWAADDDYWQGTDFLETLLNYASSYVLVFPDAILSTSDGKFEYPIRMYETCTEKIDYTKIFCSNGVGYPIYGLYNLRLFKEYNLEFNFDDDLSYYNEGTFLHKLFLRAPVKYVKESKIIYSGSIVRSSTEMQLDDFLKYFNRVILIYSLADLSEGIKIKLIDEIFTYYRSHIKDLVSTMINESKVIEIDSRFRVRKAIKVLFKGHL